jgi:hypothetical protein
MIAARRYKVIETLAKGEAITNCPYPLGVNLERFHPGDEERYSVLRHYGEERVTADLAGWFTLLRIGFNIMTGWEHGRGR